jgi:molybdopterin molybdotransferase
MADPLISIDEARRRVLDAIPGRLGVETVEIDDALDRILAADVYATGNVPPFPASAMDGYALADGSAPGTFTIVGESRAGGPFPGASLAPGEAIRISTGATVPAGATAVIRQEDTTAGETTVETHVAVAPGANVRGAGEDMRTGQQILAAGTRLGPTELGAAVAAGAGELTAARRPVLATVCTGDELRAPGEPLEPGQIHNSNAPLLRALAVRAGASALAAARVGDDAAQTEQTLKVALRACDVLVISGGVSVGPHDHVKATLARLGVQQSFWGVALQPGKPTWFGTHDGRPVFALPGNPVSTAVTFSLFVAPALEKLLGATAPHRVLTEARLAAPVPRNPSRDQMIRVRLTIGDDGVLQATSTGAQDSHMFSSLLAADALAVVPRGEGKLAPGTTVRLHPLPG